MNDSSDCSPGCQRSRAWLEQANPDILSITNPYWLDYDPPTCSEHTAIAIGYAVFMVPGILGNLLMIITFLTTSLRSHRNLMSANLAVADLIMNLEAPFVIKNSLQCGPKYFSIAGCQIYGFMGGVSGTAAIASITAMAYQRYITITRPFNEGNVSFS
jgi:r-opsin